ncbi:hypothetical protein GJR96_13460 [Haloferax sp. MBLA0076]|uniref:Uncharacterized protein n=1 Tax=Haloferax litoreum TaxID=2666140 RepID=A0A6A8GJ16_9EURY|nr:MULTISPECIES: DUF6517 family protein [Haloferax]KAB1194392.1 hypothetical protein Hfx1148_13395 [Haloferax sp. CBA1148]MRX22956.1 hypothetical protein [Haloferax litoreum]
MADVPPPPTLPSLEGWVRVDESTDRPFEFGFIHVLARTVIYEDATIRERIPAIADGPWRFLFATRLEVRPRTPPSKALTRLVVSGAASGFEERLAERGFSDVHRSWTRSLAVHDGEAEVIRYDTKVTLAGVRLAADAYLAVVPTDGEYLLLGGAYPREVVDGAGETAEALHDAIDPERFREELFRVIRRME